MLGCFLLRAAMGSLGLSLFMAVLLAGAAPAMAQDGLTVVADPPPTSDERRPVAVTRFIADFDFVYEGGKRGTKGTVHRLTRMTRVGEQVLQVGVDLNGEARVVRLVQELADNAVVNQLAVADALKMVAEAVRPDWDAAKKIDAATTAAFEGYTGSERDSTHTIATDRANDPSVLRLYPERKLASFDIRPRLPEPPTMGRDAAIRLLRDATARLDRVDGPSYIAYHAPDGLYSGHTVGVEAIDTGSWRVTADGGYCVERAPTAGWRCAAIVARDDGSYALMRRHDGHPTGEIFAEMTVAPGNTEKLFVARVPDILPPEMALELTADHTAERRDTDRTVFFREKGTFTAQVDGTVETGIWNILQDGRRCMRRQRPTEGPWQCGYLSETDGGTFALIDEAGRSFGEVLVVEGNPYNL